MAETENARKRTKHRIIFDHVHSAILSGHYKVGQRVPSESQLSRRFKTTRVTVGKAMRELEHAGFLERRSGSGSYARLPDRTETKFLGLLVPNLGEGEIFEPICSAIASAVRAHQFTVLWGQSPAPLPADKSHQAERLCQDYIEQKVDGVFFTPIELTSGTEEANQRITDMLDRAGIPLVLLDSDVVGFPQRSRYDLVGIDNRRAGYVLTEHLIQHGHGQIEFVSRPNSAHTIEARIAGYQEALFRHRITPQANWIHSGETAEIEFVRHLLAGRAPDAFVCGNDYTAAQLMQNLLALGVRVPEDVAVVGVDDLKFAKLLGIPLTTIHQPCAALGAAAVEAMIRRIDNPTLPAQDYLVNFHLAVRGSSGGAVEPSATELDCEDRNAGSAADKGGQARKNGRTGGRRGDCGGSLASGRNVRKGVIRQAN